MHSTHRTSSPEPLDKSSRNRLPRCAFFSDQDVGIELVTYVLSAHRSHVSCIVTIEENEITDIAKSFRCSTLTYRELDETNAATLLGDVDFMFLTWWPKLLPKYLIDVPRIGAINLHPSLLPHNRGKHYNFWSIVEGTPFGVTLHFVDQGIDSGDILFQFPIPKTWEDTGGSLYRKAKSAIVALFKQRYLDIVEGRYSRVPQDLAKGIAHYASELDPASEILLHRSYEAMELLNLLRARTFYGRPACYFCADGKKYEVRISISEVRREPN